MTDQSAGNIQAAPQQNQVSSNLASYSELFTFSFHQAKKIWTKILILELLLVGVMVALVTIILILAISSGVINFSYSEINSENIGPALLAGLLVLIVATMFIGAVTQVAQYQIASGISGATKALKVWWQAMPMGMNAVWVILLTSLFTMLGLFAFFIGALIIAVWLSQALLAYVIDGYKGFEALKFSKRLVSGYWWSVLARLGALMLAVIAVEILFTLVIKIMGNFIPEWVFSLVEIVAYSYVIAFCLSYSWALYQGLKKVKGLGTDQPIADAQVESQTSPVSPAL